jgi:osmotically-inducible protein OsmY
MEEKSNAYQPGDDVIREKVLQQLHHSPSIDSSKIEVLVSDAVVTLKGHADTSAEKELAGKLAAETDGVINVENHLHVEAGIAHALSNLAAHIQGDIIRDTEKE